MGKIEQTTTYFAAYTSGAIRGVLKIMDDMFEKNRNGENDIYRNAYVKLITQDKYSINRWLNGDKVGYRNHVRNAKGKLMSCEAYWIE